MITIKEIYNKISYIVQGNNPASLRARLIKGAAGSFLLQILSVLFGLISSILLAKFIGAHGYGIYTYALAWINLLMVIAAFGTNRLITREVAICQQDKQWGKLHGILRWANQLALTSSIIIAFIFAGIAFWLYLISYSEKALALIVVSFLLPFLTLSTLRQAALQGLHYVVVGLIPENLIRPLLLIIFITVSYFILADNYTGTVALANNIAAATIAFLFGSYLLYKKLPHEVISTNPSYDKSLWFKSALPFLLLSGTQAANSQIGILILGSVSDASSVGIYSVALRLASLLAFFLIAANSILAPNIATLYSVGNFSRLQSLTTKSAWAIMLLTLPVAVFLIIFGKHILALFGTEFIAGYELLVILLIGQVFNAAMGSVGLLLTMTRHEKEAMWGIIFAFILNTIFSAILIPWLGALGAAISSIANTFFWNIIFGIFVYKRTGIIPSIIGRIKA